MPTDGAVAEPSTEDLNNALSTVGRFWRESWTAEDETFGRTGPTPEDVSNLANEAVAKIEPALAYAFAEAIGGIEQVDRRKLAASQARQRVIITYRPTRTFEEVVEDFGNNLVEIARARRGAGAAIEGLEEGAVELTPELLAEGVALVEAAADLSAAGLIRAIESERGEVDEHLRLANAVVAELTPEQAREIAARPEVERIETEKIMRLDLDRSAGTVQVTEARRQNLVGTGRDIVVAVLDGEVDINHPALRGRVVRKRNYTQEGWGSPHGHGTHVAGIIAGNDATYRGMAPEATIWNYKLFPTGQTEAANESESTEGSTGADAIEDAVKDGAKIINCSWGINTTLDGNSVWAVTAERAARLGSNVCKSAGNRGPDAGSLTTPADARGDVIVVGAVNRSGTEITNFSSRGPTADGRPKPDVCAPGERIMSAQVNGGFRALSGTSMATPHVSGVVALLLQRNPLLRPFQIKKMLTDTATLLSEGDAGSNDQGRGLINVLAAAQTPAPSAEAAVGITILQRRQQVVTLSAQNTSSVPLRDASVTIQSQTDGVQVSSPTGETNLGTIPPGGSAATPVPVILAIAPEYRADSCRLTTLTSYRDPQGQVQTPLRTDLDIRLSPR